MIREILTRIALLCFMAMVLLIVNVYGETLREKVRSAAALTNAAFAKQQAKGNVGYHHGHHNKPKPSDDSGWYMYVAGTSPVCDGYCDDGDVTLLLQIPGWQFSGNPDQYGKDCWFGSKALCATQDSSKGVSPWQFPYCPVPPYQNPPDAICAPMVGSLPIYPGGCTGCPGNTTNVGDWYDGSISCCTVQIDYDGHPYCPSESQDFETVTCQLSL